MTRQGLVPECIAVPVISGYQHAEGPAFDRKGNLYFVTGQQHLVVRVTPTGQASTFCELEGWPNGGRFHRDGRLFCTDYGLGTIVEIAPDGCSHRVFADRCTEDGQSFKGPNDLAFDRTGQLYWTDPRGSDATNRCGCVYWANQQGDVRRFACGLAYPNGLAFSADWSTLYVAESATQRIHAFRILPDGSGGQHWVFAELTARGPGGQPGEPDGIAFAENGDLYVAHWHTGLVEVLDPRGEPKGALRVPGLQVSNLAFSGTALYVTESSTGGVYRLDVGVRGQRLFADW